MSDFIIETDSTIFLYLKEKKYLPFLVKKETEIGNKRHRLLFYSLRWDFFKERALPDFQEHSVFYTIVTEIYPEIEKFDYQYSLEHGGKIYQDSKINGLTSFTKEIRRDQQESIRQIKALIDGYLTYDLQLYKETITLFCTLAPVYRQRPDKEIYLRILDLYINIYNSPFDKLKEELYEFIKSNISPTTINEIRQLDIDELNILI